MSYGRVIYVSEDAASNGGHTVRHLTPTAAHSRPRVSGGLEHGLVAHLGHGIVQPGGLQVAIVPLVEVAHQVVGLLAENAHDRFAGKAGFGGRVEFDWHCPLFLRLCQL